LETIFFSILIVMVCGARLPPSRGAHRYTHEPWASLGRVSNNCYAYAVHDFERFRFNKAQPGERVGKNRGMHDYRKCGNLGMRVVADNPKKVYRTRACATCRPGHYKIMMFVAPTNKYGNSNGDFHFYKQHNEIEYKIRPGDTYKKIAAFFKIPESRIRSAVKKQLESKRLSPGKKIVFRANVWSHKQGWGAGPLLTDASGKAILNPIRSDRKYSYNYSKYCNSFCVKNRGVDVGIANTNVMKKRL
jgi:hypothetical protein